MKIAVPVTNFNKIDNHFGHCEFYSIYNISDTNEITDIKTIKSELGCGCKSNIAGVLARDGVTVMLAGGIGGGAINVLNNAGIEVIRGCSGKPDEVVKGYISGLITDSGVNCALHENNLTEGHEHICNH